MPGFDAVIKSAGRRARLAPEGEKPFARLAEFAVSPRLDDLPEPVTRQARFLLLDTIGVILGGSTAREATVLARRLGMAEGGPCTILGHPLQTSVLNAALVNGTAATWLDFDSGHRPPPGKPLLAAAHPPVHIVPTVLAVGEAVNAKGSEILMAFVVGYEVGSRIGMASRVGPKIHPHGTYHNISAAVATARLTGAAPGRMERTISLAMHLMLMPSFQNAYQGRTVRNTYAGVGAAGGILASQLAEAGFTPEENVFDSIFGGIISNWYDRSRLVAGLGETYELTQGFIKPYPMCRFGHPAIEAVEGLVRHHSIHPEEIASVEVRTFDLAATCNEGSPQTELAAKFSIPWAVASVLARKTTGPDDFRGASLEDPDLRRIAACVTVVDDPAFTAMTPARRPARITVQTRHGQMFQWEVEGSGGGPDAPLTEARLKRKFRSLADPVIGPRRAEEAVERVLQLGEGTRIREVTRYLIPPDRGEK